MKVHRQHGPAIIALFAIVSLFVVLSFAMAPGGQNAHGLAVALISVGMQAVLVLSLLEFRRRRTSPLPVSAPILSRQFERPPPATS